ncbi:hypothetical protein [Arthrobacter sp. TWP1-1]|uniref:hypothetical protein n=1 Tax=Arthrobacter sp. TWP1-1 TaxID=2804568 RepID=UPI003CEC01D7
MAPIRTHLHSSTFWSVSRPKFPLVAGHFVIRLNDPSIAFGRESAADLLRCYGHLRGALTELAGATAAHLYIALHWQPVGDAIGEPLAETSTPTLHAFFAFPDSTTAAAVLRLPAHERVAVQDTLELDEALRSWRGSAGAAEAAGAQPGEDSIQESADRAFQIEAVSPDSSESFRGGHWTAVPCSVNSLFDRMDPDSLVELAGTMEGLATSAVPPFQGITSWVTDAWATSAPATIHIFARHHGDERQQVASFVADGGLDFPLA